MVISRQGLTVTLDQLYNLIDELKEEFGEDEVIDHDREFQINIINKEECSDTWEIESLNKEEANNE